VGRSRERTGIRVGLIEAARGGTLFLDEITNTSLAMQARLLRVLQEREVRRVGENTPRQVDIRVLAATNANLAALVTEGSFGGSVLPLKCRDHRGATTARPSGDIPLADQQFLKTHSEPDSVHGRC